MEAHASQIETTPGPCNLAQAREIARKNTQAILRASRAVGQNHIAEYAGITESMASRWCSENVEALGKALAAMNLKLVPAEAKCVKDAATLDELLRWAKRGMNSLRSADDLCWEDE